MDVVGVAFPDIVRNAASPRIATRMKEKYIIGRMTAAKSMHNLEIIKRV
jgi:hypothetical protein